MFLLSMCNKINQVCDNSPTKEALSVRFIQKRYLVQALNIEESVEILGI